MCITDVTLCNGKCNGHTSQNPNVNAGCYDVTAPRPPVLSLTALQHLAFSLQPLFVVWDALGRLGTAFGTAKPSRNPHKHWLGTVGRLPEGVHPLCAEFATPAVEPNQSKSS